MSIRICGINQLIAVMIHLSAATRAPHFISHAYRHLP